MIVGPLFNGTLGGKGFVQKYNACSSPPRPDVPDNEGVWERAPKFSNSRLLVAVSESASEMAAKDLGNIAGSVDSLVEKMEVIDDDTVSLTNHNSLFKSRDWLSANQGPVFPDSVGSSFFHSNHDATNLTKTMGGLAGASNEVFQSIDDATKAKMVENVAKLASKLSEDSDAINTTSIAMVITYFCCFYNFLTAALPSVRLGRVVSSAVLPSVRLARVVSSALPTEGCTSPPSPGVPDNEGVWERAPKFSNSRLLVPLNRGPLNRGPTKYFYYSLLEILVIPRKSYAVAVSLVKSTSSNTETFSLTSADHLLLHSPLFTRPHVPSMAQYLWENDVRRRMSLSHLHSSRRRLMTRDKFYNNLPPRLLCIRIYKQYTQWTPWRHYTSQLHMVDISLDLVDFGRILQDTECILTVLQHSCSFQQGNLYTLIDPWSISVGELVLGSQDSQAIGPFPPSFAFGSCPTPQYRHASYCVSPCCFLYLKLGQLAQSFDVVFVSFTVIISDRKGHLFRIPPGRGGESTCEFLTTRGFAFKDSTANYHKIHTNTVQEPTETGKQPIRTRYLGHVTGYQPIRDQYFLIRSVPETHTIVQ
eukprot:sb/3463286/